MIIFIALLPYTATAVSGDEVSPFPPKGDVNGDGHVDTADVRFILQYIVGKAELDPYTSYYYADVNWDGAVDTTDARIMLQYIVGKIDHFSIGPTAQYQLPDDPRLQVDAGVTYTTSMSINNKFGAFIFTAAGDGVFQTPLPFRIWLPPDYNETDDPLPVFLILHAMGNEMGTDNVKQLGIEPINNNLLKRYRAIILVPQTDSWWDSGQLLEFLSCIMEHYRADSNRVYVTGTSMGGLGTIDLLASDPDMFAGAVSVCGGGPVDYAPLLENIPIWFFHGRLDPIIPVSYSRDLYNALLNLGDAVKYTEYPGLGHDIAGAAYAGNDTLDWLFEQQKETHI